MFIKHLVLVTLAFDLSGCAAADGPGNAQELLPQDTSRPAAYDTLPAKAAWIKWAAIVTVACRVEANGRSSGCMIHKTTGRAEFDAPALDYARSLVFLPAFRDGGGPVEPSHIVHIVFAATKGFPRDTGASLAVPASLPYPPQIKDGSAGKVEMSCTVGVDGNLADCRVSAVTGDRAFADAALKAIRKAHYAPAWQHGRLVREANHHLTLVFLPPLESFNVAMAAPAGVTLSKPQFGARLSFPNGALELNGRGNALVYCDLGEDGVNRNCSVGGVHGDPALGPMALAHVSSEVLHATRNGVPVAIPHRPYVVSYMVEQSQW